MKNIALALSVTIIAFLSSCNDSGKIQNQAGTETNKTTEHSGEHIYACPMHPEVTGKEGDHCPKCGMELEHNDHAGKSDGHTYKMHFASNPTAIESGKQTVLSLTPRIIGKEKEQVPLDVEHE